MPGSSALKTYVHKSEASETLDFENDPWHGSGEILRGQVCLRFKHDLGSNPSTHVKKKKNMAIHTPVQCYRYRMVGACWLLAKLHIQ